MFLISCLASQGAKLINCLGWAKIRRAHRDLARKSFTFDAFCWSYKLWSHRLGIGLQYVTSVWTSSDLFIFIVDEGFCLYSSVPFASAAFTLFSGSQANFMEPDPELQYRQDPPQKLSCECRSSCSDRFFMRIKNPWCFFMRTKTIMVRESGPQEIVGPAKTTPHPPKKDTYWNLKCLWSCDGSHHDLHESYL